MVLMFIDPLLVVVGPQHGAGDPPSPIKGLLVSNGLKVAPRTMVSSAHSFFAFTNVTSLETSSGSGPHSRTTNPMAALPLSELLVQLAPQEVAFFAHLDSQLEKVETFFSAREKELLLRTQLLQDQLRELRDHRKLVYVRLCGLVSTILISVSI